MFKDLEEFASFCASSFPTVMKCARDTYMQVFSVDDVTDALALSALSFRNPRIYSMLFDMWYASKYVLDNPKLY